MARESDIHGLLGEKLVIPSGATVAVLKEEIGGGAAQLLKYFTGGSLEIHQAPNGGMSFFGATTWAAASLAALIGNGYLMGTSEVVNLSGCARYYLMATGATVTAYRLTGLSSGH